MGSGRCVHITEAAFPAGDVCPLLSLLYRKWGKYSNTDSMQKIKIPEMITNCMDKTKYEAIYNDIAINSLKRWRSCRTGASTYIYVNGL